MRSKISEINYKYNNSEFKMKVMNNCKFIHTKGGKYLSLGSQCNLYIIIITGCSFIYNTI
jgi:hypothetical protein